MSFVIRRVEDFFFFDSPACVDFVSDVGLVEMNYPNGCM